MKKYVMTTPETKKYLADKYKCTPQAIWQALSFQSTSDMARRIRIEAYRRGGRLVEGYIPHCDTSHDTVTGIMTQRFSDRIQLTADRNTGDVTVIVSGQPRDVYHNLTITEFMKLQRKLELEAVDI